MKKRAGFLSKHGLRLIKLSPFLLFLIFPIFVSADELSDQINTWSNNLINLEKQISDLDKNIGQPLTAFLK